MATAPRPYTGPLLLAEGFRPFFLAAAGWAVLALGLWVALLTGALSGPSGLDPLAWHIHEMLFGFVMAGVAGFILTAIPNWTGRPALRGRPLAVLVALWGTARLLALASLVATPPALLVVAVDAGLPLALAALCRAPGCGRAQLAQPGDGRSPAGADRRRRADDRRGGGDGGAAWPGLAPGPGRRRSS
ncbi:NnrS family protein [Azospirillum sp. B4]|uniref:NnrS family protein n=1 Tax=Azospirillum sp. B4 TaxID=95605 RepID=UPI00034A1D71|nr:NnrS family protein [Azospirillum sp. B4]